MSRELLIKLENVWKKYEKEKWILKNINVEIYQEDFVIIEGRSGSGKSTLLNILGLFHDFEKGNYYFKKEKVSIHRIKNASNFRAEEIGFIFQSYYLIESLSIYENIMLPFFYCKKKITREVEHRFQYYMEKFNLLGMEKKKVSLLSGGEKQRVAMIRAIIREPKVVIADEPTGNLDQENTEMIIGELRALRRTGTTVIIVTHDQGIAKEGDRKFLVENGELLECIQ